MTTDQTITIKLPRKHAQDWASRCGDEYDTEEVDQTERTITLRLTPAGLADMISDARYYAAEMDPANTGDIDYRPPARTLLGALERKGLL